MKTTKLIALFAAAGLVFAACEKPETEDQTIAVESVSLDETISEGHELTEGATLDISDYVTVLPELCDRPSGECNRQDCLILIFQN